MRRIGKESYLHNNGNWIVEHRVLLETRNLDQGRVAKEVGGQGADSSGRAHNDGELHHLVRGQVLAAESCVEAPDVGAHEVVGGDNPTLERFRGS